MYSFRVKRLTKRKYERKKTKGKTMHKTNHMRQNWDTLLCFVWNLFSSSHLCDKILTEYSMGCDYFLCTIGRCLVSRSFRSKCIEISVQWNCCCMYVMCTVHILSLKIKNIFHCHWFVSTKKSSTFAYDLTISRWVTSVILMPTTYILWARALFCLLYAFYTILTVRFFLLFRKFSYRIF